MHSVYTVAPKEQRRELAVMEAAEYFVFRSDLTIRLYSTHQALEWPCWSRRSSWLSVHGNSLS